MKLMIRIGIIAWMLFVLIAPVTVYAEDLDNYSINSICSYEKSNNSLVFDFSFEGLVPKSDDNEVYLFEIPTYANESLEGKWPLAQREIESRVTISLPFRTRYLFDGFMPAIKVDGEYVPLSGSKCIDNPERLAKNRDPYPQIDSKKGLLVDAATIGTDKLDDLNVKRAVYNIPLSLIMGETECEDLPTEEFFYDGKTYYFNTYRLAGFDSVFKELTDEGYYCSAILLNDWNKKFPKMMHPLSRGRTGQSEYYAFNTEEKEGVRLMEATALFLANRYSGGEYGMVYDWIIANEVNQQKIWNYMVTDNLEYYTDSFEKSFRTFYNAIKSSYSNAKVYYSIDQCWNSNGGNNARYFNGRDFVKKFNELAEKRGNYDWGVSIHPYPDPLSKTKFWVGKFDKSVDARVLTPMNLSTFVDYFTEPEYENTKGEVRDIAVTELGLSSKVGEEIQAAAYAYCYYIIEDNEYISSFLMNRQTDDVKSLRSGLALGLYNKDYSPKYITEVFKNVDSEKKDEYIPEMLEVLGADSLEEALEWAR